MQLRHWLTIKCTLSAVTTINLELSNNLLDNPQENHLSVSKGSEKTSQKAHNASHGSNLFHQKRV
jgi:hypothetical protein